MLVFSSKAPGCLTELFFFAGFGGRSSWHSKCYVLQSRAPVLKLAVEKKVSLMGVNVFVPIKKS